MIDPTCAVHGKKMSEHECIYCSLCFKTMTKEERFVDSDGIPWDICIPCEQEEREMLDRLSIAE